MDKYKRILEIEEELKTLTDAHTEEELEVNQKKEVQLKKEACKLGYLFCDYCRCYVVKKTIGKNYKEFDETFCIKCLPMIRGDEEIYNQALNRWGKDMQLIMVIEEMAELTKALTKEIRGQGSPDKIAEEMADVKIMLEQLEIIFKNTPKVAQFKNYKINRLRKILEKK